MKKVVIIGGGVAAKGFVSASQMLGTDIEYIMIRKNRRGPVPCGIPYALGTLADANDNISDDQELLEKGMNLIIDEVVGVNRSNKTVSTLKNGEITYDELVFATGSNPIVPSFPGKDLKGIHVIEKDLDIVVEMKEIVKQAKDIVIVGGGFIGVELADEFSHIGKKNITLVELAPHCLSVAFEPEFSTEIENQLKSAGVNVKTGIAVQGFTGEHAVQGVQLNTGETLTADLVFLVIGATPNVKLAAEIGLELDEKKAIKVNSHQYTSDPSILAIGDCASKIDWFTNGVSNIRLASVASKEGRNAAYHLCKGEYPLTSVAVTNLFSTAVKGKYFGAAGMTKNQCIAAGYEVLEVQVSAVNRHPGKLPGAVKMQSKFFFDKDTLELLGAQLNGNEQVAEIVNALGISIQNKDNAYALYEYNYGTHPMGTASPNKYLFHQAATKAIAMAQSK